MAESLGTATLELEGDTSKLEKDLNAAQGKAKTAGGKAGAGFGTAMAGGLKKAALPAAAALGLLAVGAKKSIDAASNLGEQINKASVVFRGSEKQILSWSETTAESLGISQRAALEAAGVFGNMLVPMGMARSEAGKMSTRMVELAADMASFNNASPEETLDALRAGLAGETEPLRRFGVFLNDARLREEALRLGLVKTTKDALPAAAKAQATYSLILQDTADAQGDFSRTSDSVANAQRILSAQVENTAAQFGMALLPVVQDMLALGLDLVTWMQDNEGAAKVLALAIGVVSGAILLANGSLAIYNAQLLTTLRLSKGLRLALALTPWGAAILGATLLAEHFLNQEEATDKAADAQKRLTSSVRDYHAAIKEGDNARKDLHGAELRLEAAEIAVKRAIQDRTRTEKDSKSTALDRREADLRVAQAMQERRDAEAQVRAGIAKFMDSQRKQIHSTGRVKGEIEGLAGLYRGRLKAASGEAVRVTGRLTTGSMAQREALGDAGSVVKDYAAKLRGMANVSRKSNPQIARTADLAAELSVAWGRVVSLPQARSFVARFRVISTIEEHRTERRARGGPVRAGVPYIVGEHRPELFVPDVDGAILPRVDTALLGATAAASSPVSTGGRGGRGAEFHFHFPRYSGTRRELIADVKRGLDEHRRQSGSDPW